MEVIKRKKKYIWVSTRKARFPTKTTAKGWTNRLAVVTALLTTPIPILLNYRSSRRDSRSDPRIVSRVPDPTGEVNFIGVTAYARRINNTRENVLPLYHLLPLEATPRPPELGTRNCDSPSGKNYTPLPPSLPFSLSSSPFYSPFVRS